MIVVGGKGEEVWRSGDGYVWLCECDRRGGRGGVYGRVSAAKIRGCEPPPPPLCTGVDLNQLRSELEQVLDI